MYTEKYGGSGRSSTEWEIIMSGFWLNKNTAIVLLIVATAVVKTAYAQGFEDSHLDSIRQMSLFGVMEAVDS